MTIWLTLSLIAHVAFGITGTIISYALWLKSLHQPLLLGWLRKASALATISYVTAWLTGGYYYVVQYGANVKPIIKAGAYPWAHTFFMEAKEHIFLLLPFLALAITGYVWQNQEQIDQRWLQRVVATQFWLSALVTLFGVVISGAVR